MTTDQALITELPTAARIENPRLQQVLQVVLGMVILLSVLLFVLNGVVLFRFSRQLPASSASALDALGISPEFYFAGYLAISVLTWFPFISVGLLLYIRRSTEWIAILGAITLPAFGATLLPVVVIYSYGSLTAVDPVYRLFELVYYLLGPFSWPLMMIFILCFPDGVFVPRWSRQLAVFGFVVSILWGFFPQQFSNPTGAMTGVVILTPLLLFGGTLLAQVYRYRHISTPVQRLQTRWFVASIVALSSLSMLTVIPYIISPALFNPAVATTSVYVEALGVLAYLGFTPLPLAIGVAILRYRLWDIDLVINRSVVYGVVTLVLILIFGGSVVLFQQLTGATNPLAALVISAIGPVALFNPTRHRVQRLIDHHLYHLRYDLHQVAQAQQPSPVTSPGILTGRQFGPYQILDVLGHGGMGEVYRAQQAGDPPIAALKVMSGDLAADPEQVRRFAREASALTTLDHPHIVKCYGSGVEGSQPYLVMEYLQGRELAAYLRQQNRLSLPETLAVLNGIAAALDYAHGQGFIHRDIKPSNIMLRTPADGATFEAVLMDFGITKVQDALTAITGSGTIGTIDYMAPEQIMQAREVDHRADLYALGVMAYEMLTGERPFKGGAGQVLFAHLQQPPPDPRDLNPDLPRAVAKALEQALAKNPDDRYQSAGEFVAALAAARS